MDFSDRIDNQRRSYRASWRRLRRHRGARSDGKRPGLGGSEESGEEELGDFSDEDEDESVQQTLARLHREMTGVMEEVRRRREEKDVAGGEQEEQEEGMEALCRMMEETRKLSEGLDPSATVELEKLLARSKRMRESTTPREAGQEVSCL